VAKVVTDAHGGAVLAVSHVEGSLRLRVRQPEEGEEEDGAGAIYESLFVSGGEGEEGEEEEEEEEEKVLLEQARRAACVE